MHMKLQNKVALITGGASGIGKSIATLFHKEGAFVVISDVNDQKGAEVIAGFGSNASFVHLDVSNEDEWKSAVDSIVAAHGRLDVLVNNAGIIGFERDWGLQDPENATLESWRIVHGINSDGTFLGCKYAIKAMKALGGTIVNMSSRSGMIGVPGAAAYASSKASIRNHSKSVALYCAQQKYNIRCNSLQPAAILTPMWDIMLGEGETRIKNIEKMSQDIPLGRLGTPNEIAKAALFLASDDSSYMTGAELVLDGGIMAGTTTSPRKGE